ncbi:hypothetical protein P7L53_00455 [Thermoleptolyngbya sichuanensis XZ-Cy5]|uniref:hypothetical protein n=1 Tax=Thermoleptolyngbya sichuanensis TaxID=2885951 RepID=UPI00240D58B6|nr:hypothetical protein [Thermoleptolyngbya sichuanensis]MDG2614702.1 hypothetical protein [Thermoleptolyngbya sichuanensis XZ-Cy5]
MRQLVEYPSIGWVETHSQRIFLGKKTLVNFPITTAPYLLRLEIPFWFVDMAIDIWEDTLSSFIPVGFFLPYCGEPASPIFFAGQTRFLQMTGGIRSIGNPDSGADLAESWLKTLFAHFWDRYPIRAELYTSGGQYVARGHSAAEDWAQNRRLVMPDFRGAALVGAGSTIGPAGILLGSSERTLAIENLPPHFHAGSTAQTAGSHTHSFSLDAVNDHTHSLTVDSAGGHTHSLTVDSAGGHTHSLTVDSAGAHTHVAQVTGGSSNTATGGSAPRLIYQNPGTIGMTTAGAHTHTGSAASAGAHTHTGSAASAGAHTHTGSAASAGAHTHTGQINSASGHSHSLNIASEGSGVPLSVFQLSAVEHWFVSCGVF